MKLSKRKFWILVLFFTFIFVLVPINIEAKDKIVFVDNESDYSNSYNDYSEEESEDYEQYYEQEPVKKITKKKNNKNLLVLDDKKFTNQNGITISGLVLRVAFIAFSLFLFLFLIKFFLGRNRFGKPGSVLEDITQKITNKFSAFMPESSLVLKQAMVLTPGQNLYLVEVDGKRLLLGGTQQGGVQFISDLTNVKPESSESQIRHSTLPEVLMKNTNDFLANSQAKSNSEVSNSLTESPFTNSLYSGKSNNKEKNNPREFENNLNGKTVNKWKANFKQSLLLPKS